MSTFDVAPIRLSRGDRMLFGGYVIVAVACFAFALFVLAAAL